MKYLLEFKLWALYATVFTLPMYMRLNNLILGIFIVAGVIDIVVSWGKADLRQIIFRGWPVVIFFLLAFLATLHGPWPEGLKFLEKYWSFLLIPMVILPDYQNYRSSIRRVFLSLTWGCVATLAICYWHVGIDMITGNESLLDFYNPEYVGHKFTEIADTHPTYLGLFVVTVILFLLQDLHIRKWLKGLLLFFLMFGLLQLASRMPLFLFGLFFVFLLVDRIQHRRWQVGILLTGILACSATFILVGSEYMKNRMFSPEIVVDHKRVERWEVSYEIFQENPFSGAGFSRVQEIRNRKFREKGYDLAANRNYNAHNQFLEYLSTNGAFGGFVYVISFGFLLLLSVYKKKPLFSLVFLAFIIANLTESMMVRIKGIEYFALFATLFLTMAYEKKEERISLQIT